MELNPDCMRKILIYIEDNIKYSKDNRGRMQCNSFGLPNLYNADELSKFSQEDIHYVTLQLFLENYITGYRIPQESNTMIDTCKITGLTMKGHNLLDNIRENPIWTETKNRVCRAGKASIDVISNVAATVISEVIKTKMGR